MAIVTCVGSAVLDHVYEIDNLPTAEGKYFARSQADVGGGPAATAAVAISRLGGKARFVGGLGTDAAGDEILAGLESEGVDTTWVRRSKDHPSPTSAVIIDAAGERIIVNHTDQRTMTGLGALVAAAAVGADAILADLRWTDGAAAAATAAAAHGIPCVLDFDMTDIDAGIDAMATASHVVFSAPALAAITGHGDPAAGLAAIQARTAGWLAVTAGSRGTFYLRDGTTGHVPAFQVAVVDTLGAGDVFHGAFTLAVARGKAPEQALISASAAAAIKCTRPGGRSGAPTHDELSNFLEERGHGTDAG